MTMIDIEGGDYVRGSDRHYPEERPIRTVQVGPLRIDAEPVTNRSFAGFVAAKGYVTTAERDLDPAWYPGRLDLAAWHDELAFAVSRSSTGEVQAWWEFRDGASWRRPDAKKSVFADRMDHPVTCVSHADAAAYVASAGKRLPTEDEWKYAARGGLDRTDYSWGQEFRPGGRELANIWYGRFPLEQRKGGQGTTKVGSYPANGNGLHDMIGNVWEWTSSWYCEIDGTASCCVDSCQNSDGPLADSFDRATPDICVPRRVVKGGSFLCSPGYCARYRPAARRPQAIDTASVHIGFRCVQSRQELCHEPS
jgi:formylglycine-generating enzyme required for sulfatase activity